MHLTTLHTLYCGDVVGRITVPSQAPRDVCAAATAMQKAAEAVEAAKLRVAATLEQLQRNRDSAAGVAAAGAAVQEELEVLQCLVAAFSASRSRKAEALAGLEKELAGAQARHC